IKNWSREKMKSLNLWLEEPGSIITGILIGNNIVNIVFTTLFTLLVVKFTGLWDITHSFVEIISIVCSSLLILIFGEIIPKTFANTYPEKIVSLLYNNFMRFFKFIRGPINILNKISGFLAGRLGKKKEKLISRKELDIYLNDINDSGLFRKEDSRMMGKVLFLTRTLVEDVMTPRKKIYSVSLNWKYSRIMKALLKSSYSRIPAYKNNIDDCMGFIYIKDVIGVLNSEDKVDFAAIVRPAYITYDDENCQKLFKKLRTDRTHVAIVKKNGKVEGLITVEDLIEEIVGEIYDEYDTNISN
nr:CNNM domain-containing protein [Elusimicrobiota bacterium]